MSKINRSLHPVSLVLGLLLVILVIAFWPRERRRTRPIKQSAPTLASQREKVVGAENVGRAYHLRCLKLAAAGDPEGDKLIQFYLQLVGYASIVGHARLSFSPIEAQTKSVMLVIASETERYDNGFQTAANWQYMREAKIIFTPKLNDYTELWTGVRLAHELSHAMLHVTNADPGTVTLDEYLRKDEIRAHRFELRLLDRATKGEYSKIIRAWLDSQKDLPAAPKKWFTAPSKSLYDSLQVLFQAAKSDNEIATRHGATMFAMNEALAKKKNLNDFPVVPGGITMHNPHALPPP